MSSIPVLIAGHSQAKYFDKYLSISNVFVVSFSGYRKMVCTDQVDGNMQGIANPRNTKQVKNVQQKKPEGSMLSRDV